MLQFLYHPLHLAIRSWMIAWCLLMADIIHAAERSKLMRGELRAIVTHNKPRDTKTAHHLQQTRNSFRCCGILPKLKYLQPLRICIHYQQVVMVIKLCEINVDTLKWLTRIYPFMQIVLQWYMFRPIPTCVLVSHTCIWIMHCACLHNSAREVSRFIHFVACVFSYHFRCYLSECQFFPLGYGDKFGVLALL